ncbi:hypothetical protein BDV97DRAFT_421938 [Delphinella strobiligena]|nr:hypothetical protein BDV97DRAFT_421938 [Delphinella strobiligena]
MDDRSRHYMFGSRFGDFSDRNDIDTYSSASDTDSDSDWDRDPAPKITFITPVYVTHYPALSAERFIGFPHIVLTGNPPRQPVLGKNEKVNLEHADDIYTYLYHYHPDALKAFLDMNNDFFVFRTEAKKNEHDTDIILIREENKITGSPPFTFQPVPDTNNSQLGCLGHRSHDNPCPHKTHPQEWRAYFAFTIAPSGKWLLDTFLSHPNQTNLTPWQDA